MPVIVLEREQRSALRTVLEDLAVTMEQNEDEKEEDVKEVLRDLEFQDSVIDLNEETLDVLERSLEIYIRNLDGSIGTSKTAEEDLLSRGRRELLKSILKKDVFD